MGGKAVKATRKMVEIVARTCQISSIEDAQVATQAILDLIDPVPADVDVIIDRDGSRWWQPDDDDPIIWQLYGGGQMSSIMWIQEHCGPITWDGKEEA
jgi:hypothetical protein